MTPWTAECQASLSITNSRSLLKLMPIKLVMPSNHLILCRPLLLLPSVFPSIRAFWSESVLYIMWLKYWSFTFSISPCNEHSGLMSFKIDWLISLQSKGLSRGFSTIAVQKHQFFSTQLSLYEQISGNTSFYLFIYFILNVLFLLFYFFVGKKCFFNINLFIFIGG